MYFELDFNKEEVAVKRLIDLIGTQNSALDFLVRLDGCQGK